MARPAVLKLARCTWVNNDLAWKWRHWLPSVDSMPSSWYFTFLHLFLKRLYKIAQFFCTIDLGGPSNIFRQKTSSTTFVRQPSPFNLFWKCGYFFSSILLLWIISNISICTGRCWWLDNAIAPVSVVVVMIYLMTDCFFFINWLVLRWWHFVTADFQLLCCLSKTVSMHAVVGCLLWPVSLHNKSSEN